MSFARFLGSLRHEQPLVLFVPGFVAGQLLYGFPPAIPWALVAALVARCLVRHSAIQILAIAVLTGAAVGGLFRSSPAAIPSGTPLLVEVMTVHPPRVTGERSLDLSVGGSVLRCRAVELPGRNATALEPGDTVFAVLAVPERSASPYLTRRGVDGVCKVTFVSKPLLRSVNTRSRIRSWLEAELSEIPHAELLLAMSFGFDGVLTRDVEDAFRVTGLSHVLVVSGYQVTVLFGLIAMLFPRSAPCVLAMGVPFAFATAYAWLVGLEGATVRAVVALGCLTFCQYFERTRVPYQGILVALLFVHIVWPCALLERGTQLTFAALLGLVLGGTSGSSETACFAGVRPLLFATLATQAVSLLWDGACSPLAIPSNLVLAPLLSLISCPFTFVACTAAFISIDSERYFLTAVATMLGEVAWCVEWLAAKELSAPIILGSGVREVAALFFVTPLIMTGMMRMRRVRAIHSRYRSHPS